KERGREFIFEGKRRTDLIRFGEYIKGSWWDHESTDDPNKEVYAIPRQQIDINPNLEQNPGYQ
ncbi:MAG TPA: RagB/SusD family nutrient uptake outer membrane protein, partial [Sphingobacterium sp.]|nr:RagB/SusD family nutrient uptake outer membrane protein [Sphingobacterium sp.]